MEIGLQGIRIKYTQVLFSTIKHKKSPAFRRGCESYILSTYY